MQERTKTMRNNESVKTDLHHAVMDIVREKRKQMCTGNDKNIETAKDDTQTEIKSRLKKNKSSHYSLTNLIIYQHSPSLYTKTNSYIYNVSKLKFIII